MSTAVMEIAEGVEERIEAVKDEIRRLEAAKAALQGRGSGVRIEMPPIVHEAEAVAAVARATRRGRGASWKRLRDEAAKGAAKRRRTPSANRMRLGVRQVQVLALVIAKPGISSKEIAAETKTETHAYSCVGTLRAMGLIEGGHGGWSATRSGYDVGDKEAK